MDPAGPGSISHDLTEDGLLNLRIHERDAPVVIRALRDRIRRLTWLDGAGRDEFFEMFRAARLCYELTDPGSSDCGTVLLSALSREDVEILYAIPLRTETEFLNRKLNEVRHLPRRAGPVGPVEADRMAKGFVDMMTS